MDGAGTCGIWGHCPAINLMGALDSETPKDVSASSAARTTRHLIVGGRDARHIIRTIANLHSLSTADQPQQVEFYVLEQQAPLLARTILLLSLIMKNEGELSDAERAQLFLEVFGNTFLREKTNHLVATLSTQLIKLVTGDASPLSDMFDFSWLLFRERDDLENVFKFWRDEKKSFDIGQLWDYRLRHFYKTRYDTKADAVDWDYHMKLHDKASIIHKSEFLRWRLHGIAFEVRDCDYNKPNRTAATIDYLKLNGVSSVKWGYFGDIVTGPFLPYGVDTENQELLKTANDKHRHTSREVSEYNISQYIQAIEGVVCFYSNAQVFSGSTSSVKVKIVLLSCDSMATFTKLRKKNISFDSVFLSNSMAHLVERFAPTRSGESSDKLLCDTLFIESAKFMLDLNKEQTSAFEQKLEELATQSKFKSRAGQNNNAYIQFS